jgi:hypothetical protein
VLAGRCWWGPGLGASQQPRQAAHVGPARVAYHTAKRQQHVSRMHFVLSMAGDMHLYRYMHASTAWQARAHGVHAAHACISASTLSAQRCLGNIPRQLSNARGCHAGVCLVHTCLLPCLSHSRSCSSCCWPSTGATPSPAGAPASPAAKNALRQLHNR